MRLTASIRVLRGVIERKAEMADRPNFLILYTDQQQGRQLGCMGHPDLRTPHIDALARDGVLFERAYTPNTVCMPARNSFVTGLNPRGHRVFQNGCRARSGVATIPGILADSGYLTHAVGKLHLEPANLPSGYAADQLDPAGFPEAQAMWMEGRISELPLPYYGFQSVDFANGHGPGVYGDYLTWLRKTDPSAEALLNRENARPPDTGAWCSWKSALPAELHVNGWVADRAIAFLKERTKSNEPFLCWTSFPDPHFSWCPSHPYDAMYDPSKVSLPWDVDAPLPTRPESVDSYVRELFGKLKPEDYRGDALREITAHAYGMISHVDDEIGRVLATLDATGLRENTIVIFTSDHGEMLGRRGLLAKGPYNDEELIRVPLVVSCPSRFRSGVKVSSVVSTLDVPATILAMSGCVYPEDPWALASACEGLPEALPGRNLEPVLSGATDRVRDRVLVEYDEDWTGSTTRARLRSLVTERYKLNYYAGENHGEIFDLESDPEERDDLWNNPAAWEVHAWLLAELADEEIVTETWLPRRCASS